jgi:uncharacterized damage-inducible protein DinB
MEGTASAVGRALLVEAERRIFHENMPRLKKCLSILTEEEIWYRPNQQTVSVGNLVLHLCGNARQWITSGLGGAPDYRDRTAEFAEKGPISTDKLMDKLSDVMAEVHEVIRSIEPGSLLHSRRVQGFEESGLSILVHVIEHFSYHVGQITYYVKSLKNMDLKYYEGVDLNRKSA